MKKDFTYIAFVLDRSGSMSSVADDVVGAYKEFITEQKKQPGKALFTLAQFDDRYDVVHDGVPLEHVSEELLFEPRGMTALLDAVGKTINSVGTKLREMPESERPSQVVFVIQTDGHENHSSEFTNQQITDMIKHQTNKYNWQFVFLGADQDAFASAASIGINSNWVMSYTGSSTRGAIGSSLNSAMSRYRSSGEQQLSNFFSASDLVGVDAEASTDTTDTTN